MKRIISLFVALIMCAAVICPVVAYADRFVPSIGYKDGPGIDDAEIHIPGGGDDSGEGGGDHGGKPGGDHGGKPGGNQGGNQGGRPGGSGGVGRKEKVTHCVVVTSIAAAEEKTTDIKEESREKLLEVYTQVQDGKLELPVAKEYVVRELVDVSFCHKGCVDADHTHEEDLAQEGATATISFDLGVKAETNVQVLVFKDGVWNVVEEVVNNGDGTVTCTFDHFGTVAFCVEEAVEYGPGVQEGPCIWCWLVILLIALTVLVALLVWKRRKDHR